MKYQRLFFIVPFIVLIAGIIFAPSIALLVPILCTIILLPLAFSEYPFLSWSATAEWLTNVRVGRHVLKKRRHNTVEGLKATFLYWFKGQNAQEKNLERHLLRSSVGIISLVNLLASRRC